MHVTQNNGVTTVKVAKIWDVVRSKLWITRRRIYNWRKLLHKQAITELEATSVAVNHSTVRKQVGSAASRRTANVSATGEETPTNVGRCGASTPAGRNNQKTNLNCWTSTWNNKRWRGRTSNIWWTTSWLPLQFNGALKAGGCCRAARSALSTSWCPGVTGLYADRAWTWWQKQRRTTIFVSLSGDSAVAALKETERGSTAAEAAFGRPESTTAAGGF